MSQKQAKEQRRFRELMEEAQSFRLQYMGSDLQELERIMGQWRELRKGKPDCYMLSFDPKHEKCRKCELFKSCADNGFFYDADLTQAPREIVECRAPACDGDLIIELVNGAGDVVDHGCSTPGCPNTVNRQRKVMNG